MKFWYLGSHFSRFFLSATKNYPLRTIIRLGWVSSLMLFYNGITWKCFELSSWNFAWWLVMTLCFESQFVFQFRSRRPAQPAYQPKIQKWANLANFHPIEFKLGTELIYNLPDSNWMFEVHINTSAFSLLIYGKNLQIINIVFLL